MYTQCPECSATYRVTAPVLQQAGGRVRCGGCGKSFSAIDQLSEEMPESNSRVGAPAGDLGSELAAADQLSETNRQLLEVLDEFAGSSDVRIEDTGTEWRVLDGDFEDSEADQVEGAQSSLDLEVEGSPELDEPLAGLALSEPEEWTELLDEVREDAARPASVPLEVEEEIAKIHTELSATEIPAPVEQDIPAGAGEVAPDAEIADSGDPVAAEGIGTADDEEEIDADNEIVASESDAAAEPDSAEREEEVAPEDATAQMVATAKDEPVDFAAALAGLNDPSKLFDDNPLEVETIIMEGDSVRNAIEQERLEAENEALDRFGPAANLYDSYASNRAMRGGRRSTDPASYGVTAGTVLLGLLLVGQVIHAYRETLSTYGLFNQTIGSVYRLLGQHVTPAWNILGWQFEATNGSIADDRNVLTILSRIGNNSQSPLPYPLVHVSLTDRFEEIVGSRVLTPDEYLAGDLDPGRPVIPGENFTAVITIDEPSVDATGFKLNVCYRAVPGKVRCATEDFKN